MRFVFCLGGEIVSDPLDFHFVFVRVESAADQTETQIHQIRIHGIGFAIIADFLQPARVERLPHLAAVHTQLARKAAQFRHIVQRHIRPRLVKREQIHQIAVALVITADVVVPLEIAAVAEIAVAHIPIARGVDPYIRER